MNDNSDQQSAATDPRLDIARQNIRLAVTLRNTNYAEVSKKAGLSRNILGMFVNGKRSMTYENLLKVCDVLDVPIGILHRPDSITNARLKLYGTIFKLPDHLLTRAIEDVASK
jgi:transcriptional regulator with XRE-family HTH domain